MLFKRGMGITLEESLNACEYVASEGNPNIVFCLRGVKTHLGDPHRNLVDFAHVPVVRRQTRLPVCIDPSHCVGRLTIAPDGLPDIFHVIGAGRHRRRLDGARRLPPARRRRRCATGRRRCGWSSCPRFVEYVRRVRACYDEVTRGAGE